MIGSADKGSKKALDHGLCDGVMDTCSGESLLPKGVIRVTPEALASERLLAKGFHPTQDAPVKIAAFDFDGTCISGSSPKKLVKRLTRLRRLSLYKLIRIGVWGLAYKMNKPRDDEGVRGRVFSAFAGLPALKVNEQLCEFYANAIDPLFRMEADACMFAHLEQGHAVVVISASFEPMIASAMTVHPIQFAMASRMHIDENGCYTDQVEGLPTEGPAKVEVLRTFADAYFGEGMWELGWAYGDHYSDLELLQEAEHPCAVTPDKKLEDHARSAGWEIADWV